MQVGTHQNLSVNKDVQSENRSKKRVIVAMPRTYSTAITRALVHATQVPALHEVELMKANNEAVLDAASKVSQALSDQGKVSSGLRKLTKDTIKEQNIIAREEEAELYIKKEMATLTPADVVDTDISAVNRKMDDDIISHVYDRNLEKLIEGASEAVILFTGNPLEIFYSTLTSLVKDELETSGSRLQKGVLSGLAKEAFDVVQENSMAMKRLKRMMDRKGQHYIEFDKGQIGKKPETVIRQIADIWGLPLKKDMTLQLAEVGTTGDKSEQANYKLTYDDPWTDKTDQEKSYFEPRDGKVNYEKRCIQFIQMNSSLDKKDIKASYRKYRNHLKLSN